jgi:O-antigen ligase
VTHLFPHATLLLLAWGALAFGAEYAWAYAPVMVFSVAVGLLGFVSTGNPKGLPPQQPGLPAPSPKPLLALTLALTLLVTAVAVQLIPLPKSIVASLSPAGDAVNFQEIFAKETLRELPVVANDAPRPLSIFPSRTWLGMAFLVTFAFLLMGSVRGLGVVGAVGIARGIVVLGVIAAFLQIFQLASGSPEMYGLFMTRQGNQFSLPSVPFGNRNHTAGWLVMALSLSMGHLAGCVARGMRGVRPQWRDRILWLSSGDASETLLTAFAIAVMAIAIVLTQSRSGALCLVLATMLFAWWAVRRQASTSRRLLMSIHVMFVLAAAAIMGGADAVVRRFSESTESLGGRLGVWGDTLPIISDFALTGTGLNTYGIAMMRYQTYYTENRSRFIEAHNDYLQIAAEGGLLLGVPILILLGVVINQVRRRFREGADDTRTYWLRAGAVTALLAIAVQSIFDFTLQMSGAAAMFVVLAAIALHHPRPRSSRSPGTLKP